MATLWVKGRQGCSPDGFTQIEFSTGYTFGFWGFKTTDAIKVIGGGRIEDAGEYLIKKVKISKDWGSGFWWLGESREAYFGSFRELINEIAPGCLTRRCVITQLVVERV